MMENNMSGLSFDTLAIHADPRDERSVSPPIYQTSTFFSPDADTFRESATGAQAAEFYTRYGNPTRARAEALLAALEGGDAAMLAASGMGAISTMMLALLSSGAVPYSPPHSLRRKRQICDYDASRLGQCSRQRRSGAK